MARQVTTLNLMLASPGELSEERDALTTVVRDLNRSIPRERGIQIELIKWETHSWPGIGEDAQDVVNQQLPEDIDIFVGMFWKRLGTATKRASSGTVEEFNRALARFEANQSAIRILMYFKSESIPYDADLEEFKKVRDFRDSLKEKGVKYHEFATPQEFTDLLRLHLQQELNNYGSKWGPSRDVTKTTPAAKITPQNIDNDLDDFGLFDLMEHVQESSNNANAALHNLESHMTTMSQNVTAVSQRIGNTTIQQKFADDPKGAKREVNSAAEIMETFVRRATPEIEVIEREYTKAFEALLAANSLVHDFENEGDELSQYIAIINNLRKSMGEAQNEIQKFREANTSLPRLTTKLNRAKKEINNLLTRLEDFFASQERILIESVRVLTEPVGSIGKSINVGDSVVIEKDLSGVIGYANLKPFRMYALPRDVRKNEIGKVVDDVIELIVSFGEDGVAGRPIPQDAVSRIAI